MKKIMMLMLLGTMVFGACKKEDVQPSQPKTTQVENYVILKHRWQVYFDNVKYNPLDSFDQTNYTIDTIYNKTNDLPVQHLYYKANSLTPPYNFYDSTYVEQWQKELVVIIPSN